MVRQWGIPNMAFMDPLAHCDCSRNGTLWHTVVSLCGLSSLEQVALAAGGAYKWIGRDLSWRLCWVWWWVSYAESCHLLSQWGCW